MRGPRVEKVKLCVARYNTVRSELMLPDSCTVTVLTPCQSKLTQYLLWSTVMTGDLKHPDIELFQTPRKR